MDLREILSKENKNIINELIGRQGTTRKTERCQSGPTMHKGEEYQSESLNSIPAVKISPKSVRRLGFIT